MEMNDLDSQVLPANHKLNARDKTITKFAITTTATLFTLTRTEIYIDRETENNVYYGLKTEVSFLVSLQLM